MVSFKKGRFNCMVQEVQLLNKKIENINTQRTKAEARVEMLKKQLIQGIMSYNSTYGVDLNDKSFPKLSGKVTAELSKISDEIKAEYELKRKVVIAIEEGRYEDAYKLLGITNEDELSDDTADVDVEESIVPDVDVSSEDDFDIDLGVEDGEDTVDVSSFNLTVEDDEDSNESDDDDMTFGVVLDEEEEQVSVKPEIDGQGALDAVMTVEDDDDEVPSMDDMDFGFGDILSGTKFQN